MSCTAPSHAAVGGVHQCAHRRGKTTTTRNVFCSTPIFVGEFTTALQPWIKVEQNMVLSLPCDYYSGLVWPACMSRILYQQRHPETLTSQSSISMRVVCSMVNVAALMFSRSHLKTAWRQAKQISSRIAFVS